MFGVLIAMLLIWLLYKVFRLVFSLAKLADILGHSSINTTRIYIVSTGREHRRKMEQMRLLV